MDTLDTPAAVGTMKMTTIKGVMTAVSNGVWTLNEAITEISWMMPNVTKNETLLNALEEQWPIDAAF